MGDEENREGASVKERGKGKEKEEGRHDRDKHTNRDIQR